MTTVSSLVEAIEQQSDIQPEGLALIDDHEQITWAEFARRIAASAAGLEKLGLAPGERIGLHGLNSIELAVTMLGCWKRGLITVLLTPGSKAFEVQQEVAATGAVAYVGDAELYPVGQAGIRNCPALRLALVLRRGALLARDLPELPALQKEERALVRPAPRLSGITTWNCFASAGAVSAHDCRSAPSPVSSTRASPLPASS